LKIPIYIAQGTADVNTSPLSADYLRLEFLDSAKIILLSKVTQIVTISLPIKIQE
jgi:hypothetical protein